jgi:hypothetical protein
LSSFALGAAALQLAVHDRAEAGAVIAAIFEPPQPLDQRPATCPLPTIPIIPHIIHS